MDSEENLDNDPLMRETIRVWLQDPVPDRDYYCISLLGNEGGTIECSITSEWCGFTDTTPRYEIRRGSPLDGESYRVTMREAKLPFSMVNDVKDLYIFRLIGGWGIVLDELAKRYFGYLVEPSPVIKTYSPGFSSPESIPDELKNHAPTKKTRMATIKRDGYRCKVCGRAPKDYVDIELHVHHVLPRAMGGATEAENLISLCNTCHGGLDPHHEPQLINLLNLEPYKYPLYDKEELTRRLKLYMDGVAKQLIKLS